MPDNNKDPNSGHKMLAAVMIVVIITYALIGIAWVMS